jgi:hypothetical protein
VTLNQKMMAVFRYIIKIFPCFLLPQPAYHLAFATSAPITPSKMPLASSQWVSMVEKKIFNHPQTQALYQNFTPLQKAQFLQSVLRKSPRPFGKIAEIDVVLHAFSKELPKKNP